MADLISILTWAIPSGGISAAIAWVANRKVKEAEQAKKIHDTYKEMYGDISEELLTKQRELNESAKENARAIEKLNKENALTRSALNRLSRAIEAIQLCPHRASCPVSGELRQSEDSELSGKTDTAGATEGSRKSRQRKPKHNTEDSERNDNAPMDAASGCRHSTDRDTT